MQMGWLNGMEEEEGGGFLAEVSGWIVVVVYWHGKREAGLGRAPSYGGRVGMWNQAFDVKLAAEYVSLKILREDWLGDRNKALLASRWFLNLDNEWRYLDFE